MSQIVANGTTPTFEGIDDLAKRAIFDEPLIFEKHDGGFRFGNKNNMHFVPCYSEQNGFYDDSVIVEYNGVKVFHVTCEEHLV